TRLDKHHYDRYGHVYTHSRSPGRSHGCPRTLAHKCWCARAVTIAALVSLLAAMPGCSSGPAAGSPVRVAVDPVIAQPLKTVLGDGFDLVPVEPDAAAGLISDGSVEAGVYLQPLDTESTSSEMITFMLRVSAAPTLEDGERLSLEQARSLKPAVRLLPAGGIRPTYEEIVSGRYPDRDPIYLVTRKQTTLERLLPAIAARKDRSPLVANLLRKEETPALLAGIERTVSLTVVGDIMLARGVGGYIKRFGLDYPMSLVASVIASSDITFANLESPIGVTGRPLPGKLIWFRAEPATVECLAKAGIDVVTLANNHTLDFDSENLLETIEILKSKDIAHVGAGRDLSLARKPAVIERKGLRVAFLGYNEFANPSLFWSTKYPRTLMAAPGQPGTPPIDMEMIRDDIAEARQIADVVAVSYHWGQEYTNHPLPYFGLDLKQIARNTIDLGADMVLGFHPHAIQGIEVYRGKPILYSLGNFVMDQKRSVTCESMIVRFELSKRGVEYMEVTPARIEDGRPRPLDGEEARSLMDKIRSISSALN
ncbi:MAG: CapA family protein, partial [Bacillota bacterium]